MGLHQLAHPWRHITAIALANERIDRIEVVIALRQGTPRVVRGALQRFQQRAPHAHIERFVEKLLVGHGCQLDRRFVVETDKMEDSHTRTLYLVAADFPAKLRLPTAG